MTAVLQSKSLSDDQLVHMAASGDLEAQNEWVSRFMPRVWRFVCLNCSNRSDVDDLVQTAMISALENLHTYQGPKKFCAWLDRLTINVIRTYFRKTRFKRLFFLPLEATPEFPDYHNTSEQIENRQLLLTLSLHLSKISPKNKEALVLSMLMGYGAKEIAEICGCSVEAAWKRTRRGYQELMTRVGGDLAFKENLLEFCHE